MEGRGYRAAVMWGCFLFFIIFTRLCDVKAGCDSAVNELHRSAAVAAAAASPSHLSVHPSVSPSVPRPSLRRPLKASAAY